MRKNLRILIALIFFIPASFLSAQITWTGTINSDWNNSGNWSTHAIPTSADNVIIPDVPSNQ